MKKLYSKASTSKKSVVSEATALPYGALSQGHIPAGEFKARCLELMEKVRDWRKEIVITKYGIPVAKLVPFDDTPPDIVGFMRGSVLSYGDLISPVGERWEADE